MEREADGNWYLTDAEEKQVDSALSAEFYDCGERVAEWLREIGFEHAETMALAFINAWHLRSRYKSLDGPEALRWLEASRALDAAEQAYCDWRRGCDDFDPVALIDDGPDDLGIAGDYLENRSAA